MLHSVVLGPIVNHLYLLLLMALNALVDNCDCNTWIQDCNKLGVKNTNNTTLV